MGAWAELVRYERIRGNVRAQQYRRHLWHVFVCERDVADLSTFQRYHDCGLDPRIAVADHTRSQRLADELRAEGFRGVLSPSAALSGAINLTVFGERFEKRLLFGLNEWPNRSPDIRWPCSKVAERASPPEVLTTETTFRNMEHDAYRQWLLNMGLPMPLGPP